MNYETLIVGEDTSFEDMFSHLENSEIISFDMEGSGLDPYDSHPLLLQFGVPHGDSTIVYVAYAKSLTENAQNVLQRVWSNSRRLFLMHNAKFDSSFLKVHYGIEPPDNIWDTHITESSLTLGKHLRTSLEKVAERRLGIKVDKSTRQTFAGLSQNFRFSDEQIRYAAQDVALLFPIYEQQSREAEELGLENVVQLENGIVKVTMNFELNGMLLDVERWDTLIDYYESELLSVLHKMYNLVGENTYIQSTFLDTKRAQIERYTEVLNSNDPATIKEYLLDLGYNVENTTAQTLQQLEGDFPQTVLDYRKYQKLLSTYLWKMEERISPTTGRIHPDYNQLPTFDSQDDKGATTGRYSSGMQQIPRNNKLRNCFIARPGYKIITADYSGVEMRIMANMSKDKNLVEFFLSDMDDIHSYTASIIYRVPIDKVKKEQRQISKNINYGYMYGATAKGLSWRYNIDEKIMEEAFRKYEKSFPGLVQTTRYFANYAERTGTIRDAIGRVKFFDNIPENKRYTIERKAKNFPIQATSASQLKFALYNMGREFTEPNIYFYGTFHDEIVLEVKEEIAEAAANRMAEIMSESAMKICPGPVPYLVDYHIDNCWVK